MTRIDVALQLIWASYVYDGRETFVPGSTGAELDFFNLEPNPGKKSKQATTVHLYRTTATEPHCNSPSYYIVNLYLIFTASARMHISLMFLRMNNVSSVFLVVSRMFL